MFAVQSLRRRLGDLLKADTTTINQVANNLEIHLVTTPFVPSDALTLASFTDAVFAGSTALLVALGPQVTANDPVSGNQNIILQAPVGGWTWICTAPPGAPVLVTGVILTDHLRVNLLGMQNLDVPVTIRLAGDGVLVEDLLLTIPAGTMQV